MDRRASQPDTERTPTETPVYAIRCFHIKKKMRSGKRVRLILCRHLQQRTSKRYSCGKREHSDRNPGGATPYNLGCVVFRS
jgi:hypothetical protein